MSLDRSPSHDKLFLSYSHEDASVASSLAKELNKNGVPVWYDKWDLKPGDSLISKIFEEGLSECKIFAILLSVDSVKSEWVRSELDSALLRRLEGLTRVVPILVNECNIPLALRSLRWIDLHKNRDDGVRDLINIYHDIDPRPTLGPPPKRAQLSSNRIGDLSTIASAVCRFMLRSTDVDSGRQKSFLNSTIASETGLSPQELNDCIDELKDAGLVRTNKELGTHPYSFAFVYTTYLFFIYLKDEIDYNPFHDIYHALVHIASNNDIDNKSLADSTQLSPGRLNRAVDYIDDLGFAKIRRALGTGPFSFWTAVANRKTRELASHGVDSEFIEQTIW